MGTRILLAAMTPAVLLGTATTSEIDRHTSTQPCNSGNSDNFELRSTIALLSTRDHIRGEIYLLTLDGTNPHRLTTNTACDGFPTLSPDGKKIVFDSNRNIPGFPANISDLFMMNADGTDQTLLVRGSSATWSPDCKRIAFHASASGTGTPIRNDPGSATSDSDLFVVNVDDLLAGIEQPTNITASVDKIEDDADWSPDGQTIVYTAHDVDDDPELSTTAEVHLINADGTGTPTPLTDNDQEERGPAWSPDGDRIAYMCGMGPAAAPFEICVMNADGTNPVRRTFNDMHDGIPTWSPDGDDILFARTLPGPPRRQQLFVMDAECSDPDPNNCETQLTFPPGMNTLADWGQLRVHVTP